MLSRMSLLVCPSVRDEIPPNALANAQESRRCLGVRCHLTKSHLSQQCVT